MLRRLVTLRRLLRFAAIDTLAVVDRLRPSDEDIAKAFRQSVEAQDAALDPDEPAIAGPVPLPKRRPPPHP
jgi:hypothetical protein